MNLRRLLKVDACQSKEKAIAMTLRNDSPKRIEPGLHAISHASLRMTARVERT